MSLEKPDGLTSPAPEWVEEQCKAFDAVLEPFVQQMREYFRQRALEGRARWDDPAAAEKLYMDLVAHAYHSPLCANEEAHVANFACFLWNLRMQAARGA